MLKKPNQTYTHKEKNMSFETPKLPEVKFSRNGYEIRTDILAMAKDLVAQEYTYKYNGWEISSERDPKTGQAVSLNPEKAKKATTRKKK